MSSAYNDSLCCSPFIISPFMLLSSLIICASGSIQILNSRGDGEQSCLQPRSRRNQSDRNPFTLTAVCGLEYNVCVHFMKLGTNWTNHFGV